jgi:hypothetical protein
MTDSSSPQHQPADAEDFRKVPHPSEDFGTLPHASAPFGNVPQPSEPFGSVPNAAETFRTVPQAAAFSRKESHTLTVREVARRFEAAGVARSERSIVNWCQRDPLGASRLDAYYDPNERRYYITPESVGWAIAEEQAKAARLNEGKPAETPPPAAAEPESVRKRSEPASNDAELLKENFDLKITNRAKDMFIEQLQKERDGLLNQVVNSSRRIGELETKLLQLDAPDETTSIDSSGN